MRHQTQRATSHADQDRQPDLDADRRPRLLGAHAGPSTPASWSSASPSNRSCGRPSTCPTRSWVSGLAHHTVASATRSAVASSDRTSRSGRRSPRLSSPAARASGSPSWWCRLVGTSSARRPSSDRPDHCPTACSRSRSRGPRSGTASRSALPQRSPSLHSMRSTRRSKLTATASFPAFYADSAEFALEQPPTSLVGDYQYESQLVDAGGNGWSAVASFTIASGRARRAGGRGPLPLGPAGRPCSADGAEGRRRPGSACLRL